MDKGEKQGKRLIQRPVAGTGRKGQSGLARARKAQQPGVVGPSGAGHHGRLAGVVGLAKKE